MTEDEKLYFDSQLREKSLQYALEFLRLAGLESLKAADGNKLKNVKSTILVEAAKVIEAYLKE